MPHIKKVELQSINVKGLQIKIYFLLKVPER